MYQYSLRRHLHSLVAVLSVSSSLAMFGVSNASEIPIESLTKLPAISSLSISEDGEVLTGLVRQGDAERLSLGVWDLNDMSKPPNVISASGDVDFMRVSALKAGKIIVQARKKWTGALAGCGEGNAIGSTKTYLFKTLVTDTEFSEFGEPFSGESNLRGKTDFEKVCNGINGTGGLAANLPLDPENVIIFQRSSVFDRESDYLKYNLRTGKSEKLFSDFGNENVGLMHPKTGKVLTRTYSDYGDGRYKGKFKIVDDSGKFKTHENLTSDSNGRYNISILGLDDASGKYFIATDKFSDKQRVYMYDARTEQFDSTPKFSHDKFDVRGITRSTRDDDFGKVLGYSIGAANVEMVYLDPVLKAVQDKFLKQFPGKSVRISDWSRDRTKLIVVVEGSDMPPSYFLTTDMKSFKFLGSRNPELSKTPMSKTELVYYPARDGKQIPGLLTMPTGWKKGDPAPSAIIHPHGGPWARDYAGWDASGWVPFLTSRGYAVLQPQYRGSTGWGRDIWLSGDAEWGQAMQDDKDDGANWMVENGYADADRIAIFGYSYGGFAAFAAAVRPGGPFKCAIAGAGVSDLTNLGRNWSNNPLQRAYQGKTVKGMDPMKNAENISMPMLMFHGDRDVRVPDSHAKRFHKKIKKKVKSELVIVKDMPHSMPWSTKMQNTSLQAIEDFLENDCFG